MTRKGSRVADRRKDNTDSKKVEEQLRLSETKYRVIADNTYDWEFWVDPSGNFLYSSPSCERITGYAAHEFESNPNLLTSIIHPQDLPDYVAHAQPADVPAVPVEVEFRITRRDGGERWIGHVCQAVYDMEGRFLGRRGSNRDITVQKRAELLREEYVSLISHDLRTPLGVIIGQADILLHRTSGPANNQFVKDVETILAAGRKMNAMIQDLVDTARLESGTMEMRWQLVSLPRLVQDLVERAIAPGEARRLKTKWPGNLPLVQADPDRLERVLVNLINNALKYSSPRRSVRIRAECTGTEILVAVADRGIGISADDLPHILERFYRAKTPRPADGMGLGLYISKMLVEAHGGRIWVESEACLGSTFYFTLPLA